MRTLDSEEMMAVCGGDSTTVVVIQSSRLESEPIDTSWLNTSRCLDTVNLQQPDVASVGTDPTDIQFSYHVTKANLTIAQKAVLTQILNYGIDHGYTVDETTIAINQAFYESDLGLLNQNGSFKRLFQYDDTTWNALGHGTTNIWDNGAQIVALFQDIQKYEARYATGIANGDIPTSLNFADYFEVKHHNGNNSVEWNSPYITEYEDHTQNNFGFGFDVLY